MQRSMLLGFFAVAFAVSTPLAVASAPVVARPHHAVRHNNSNLSAQPVSAAGRSVASSASSSRCDQSLWNHVYAGDPRRFAHPQDRLTIIQGCVQVSGVIETAVNEADGDVHIRLRLDPRFAPMLNPMNDRQHGDLVLEPICVRPPTQRDTIDQHACDNFNQTFDRSLVGRHVQVVGAYVTDQEHGWNEIHPVTSITRD